MAKTPTHKFKTLEFPNNAGGQRRKLETIHKMEADGWEVVEETIQPAQFDGVGACCAALICLPLAFVAYRNGRIVVAFRKTIPVK